MSVKQIQKAYESAMMGADDPSQIVTPEGAFLKHPDGRWEVFGYDHEGELYDLPEAEQRARLETMRARIAKERQ